MSQLYKKIIFHLTNIKKSFILQNIAIINLLLDVLKLIAQSRNISDYENKSEKNLVKALSKPKPKLEIRINKKKLEKTRKNFNELRRKFSKTEIDKYRKAFYDIKNYKHLFTSEIKKVSKNLTNLKKV